MIFRNFLVLDFPFLMLLQYYKKEWLSQLIDQGERKAATPELTSIPKGKNDKCYA